MNNKYTKGSEWRKWDLHTHTPIDHEWQNKPDLNSEEEKKKFAKKYINTALEQKLSLIAITNHNFYQNKDDLIIPYIREEAKDKEITILPGFEITINNCSGVHVLVIFSEKTRNEEIMGIVDQLFAANQDKIDKNGQVIPSNKNLKEIKAIIDEAGHEAVYIFAHADRTNGVLSERSGTNRKRLWLTDFVRIAQLSKSPEDFNEGFEYNVINNNDKNYSKKMTYIIASDCRSLDDLETNNRNKLGEKYTWVKADPTFEGLKQIIYEPEDRVRIQSYKPEDKKYFLVIDKIRFFDNANDKIFSNNWIELNKNLNAIIGGKSTGKSLLLYHIAKTIDPLQVEENVKDLDINYNDLDIDFEVKWRDGRIDKLSDDNDLKERQITYIPQMFINRLAEPGEENRKRLNNLIKNILLENDNYKKFYENQIEQINNRKTEINKNITQLFNLKEKIKEMQLDLKKFNEKKVIKEEISKITNRINDLKKESKLTEDETEKHERLIKLKDEKEKEVSHYSEVNKKLTEYKNSVKENIENSSDNINKKFEEVKMNFNNKQDVIKLFKNLTESTISKLENIIKENNKSIDEQIKENKNKKKKLLDELKEIKNELKPILKKFKNQGLLKKLQKELEEQKEILEKIKEKEKEIKIIKNEYNETKNEIISNYEIMMNEYKILRDELEKDKYKKIAGNISLFVKLVFDINEFYKYFTDIFDKRSNLNEKFDCFNKDNQYKFIEDSHVNSIKMIFNKLLNLKGENNEKLLRLRSGNNLKDAITKLFDDYFKIEFDLVQNDDRIVNMSPGKRGLVLLKLYLQISNAQYPILIDQPEDNLDNRTIYKELNTFIRNKKVERQIIIVTHNANLVVSADAEEVIVANQKGQQLGDNKKYKFEYVTGSLENTFIADEVDGVLFKKGIREHTCEILEGGQKAFENREKKYGFGK